MMLKTIQRKLVLPVVLMTGFAFTGCDFTGLTDTADDFKVIIGLEPINTTATVLLTDAKSGELVNTPVTITYDGQNGDDIIDIYSDPKTEDEVDNGILNFSLNNAVQPTEDNPAEVTLLISANGYYPSTKTVQIDAEGSSEFDIELLKESDKPESVETTSATNETDEEGATTSDIVVQSSGADNEEEAATLVEIGAGTIFKDENGNTLSGKLTTEMSNFDLDDFESMSAFPFENDEAEDEIAEDEILEIEGLSLIEVKDENGNLAFDSEESAKQKYSNSGRTTFTYYLPNYRVIVGNLISVHTFTRVRGARRPVINSYRDIPVEIINGRKAIRFEVGSVPHAIRISRIIRGVEPILEFDRNGYNGHIAGVIHRRGHAVRFYLGSRYQTRAYTARRKVAMKDYVVTITKPIKYRVPGFNNFSQNPIFNITLPERPPNMIDATVEVSLVCQDRSESVAVTGLPGSAVAYRNAIVTQEQSNRWKIAKNLNWDYDEDEKELSGGSFDIFNVAEGDDYTFKIVFDGNEYKRDINISGPNVSYEEVIKEDICQ